MSDTITYPSHLGRSPLRTKQQYPTDFDGSSAALQYGYSGSKTGGGGHRADYEQKLLTLAVHNTFERKNNAILRNIENRGRNHSGIDDYDAAADLENQGIHHGRHAPLTAGEGLPVHPASQMNREASQPLRQSSKTSKIKSVSPGSGKGRQRNFQTLSNPQFDELHDPSMPGGFEHMPSRQVDAFTGGSHSIQGQANLARGLFAGNLSDNSSTVFNSQVQRSNMVIEKARAKRDLDLLQAATRENYSMPTSQLNLRSRQGPLEAEFKTVNPQAFIGRFSAHDQAPYSQIYRSLYGHQKCRSEKRNLGASASCKDSRIGKPSNSLKPDLRGGFKADPRGGRNPFNLDAGQKKQHDASKASGDISESTAIGTTFHGGKNEQSVKQDKRTEAGDIFERDDESLLDTTPEDLRHRLKTSKGGITDIIINEQESAKKKVIIKKSSIRAKKGVPIKIKKAPRATSKAAVPAQPSSVQSLPQSPKRLIKKGTSSKRSATPASKKKPTKPMSQYEEKIFKKYEGLLSKLNQISEEELDVLTKNLFSKKNKPQPIETVGEKLSAGISAIERKQQPQKQLQKQPVKNLVTPPDIKIVNSKALQQDSIKADVSTATSGEKGTSIKRGILSSKNRQSSKSAAKKISFIPISPASPNTDLVTPAAVSENHKYKESDYLTTNLPSKVMSPNLKSRERSLSPPQSSQARAKTCEPSIRSSHSPPRRDPVVCPFHGKGLHQIEAGEEPSPDRDSSPVDDYLVKRSPTRSMNFSNISSNMMSNPKIFKKQSELYQNEVNQFRFSKLQVGSRADRVYSYYAYDRNWRADRYLRTSQEADNKTLQSREGRKLNLYDYNKRMTLKPLKK